MSLALTCFHDIFAVAGLPPEKLVEAHGTFSWATCTICGSKKEGSEVKVCLYILFCMKLLY